MVLVTAEVAVAAVTPAAGPCGDANVFGTPINDWVGVVDCWTGC